MATPDLEAQPSVSSITPGEELLIRLQRSRGKGLTARELLAPFALERSARQELIALLDELVGRGLLVRRADRRYALPSLRVRLAIGVLSRQRAGHGFVTTANHEEIYVAPRELGGAMDGDRVVVGVERRPGRFDQRPQGRSLYVLQHAHQEILGQYLPTTPYGQLLPLYPRFGPPLLIPAAAGAGIRPGQIAVGRIDDWRGRGQSPLGTIVSILGDADDPAVDALAVAYRYRLPTAFSAPAVALAQQLATPVSVADCSGRADLRALPLVTIDGEDARDFDDAVAVRSEPDGQFRLWVAIADVSHYVTPESLLDQEARQRGTSVYFPDRCLPMLPESLSNGICSLQPGAERLVLVAELLFAADGQRLEQRFYPAVMRSHARLTYTQVQSWFAGDFVAAPPELYRQALVMLDLAEKLTARRMARGSLDFDLPEADIRLDERGRPQQILRRVRTAAHRLIEEFMLAANEAVAEYLASHGVPVLYRVHPLPETERLEALQEFLAHLNLGLVISEDATALAHALQELLAATDAGPRTRAVHQMLLRSMQQAYYAPVNIGHFGLAAKHYCHFTSPIRRYPDLVVHRLLRQLWQDQGQQRGSVWSLWQQRLPELGAQLSLLERRAMEAERDLAALYKCRFMQEKIGEEYVGTVVSVQPFGLFVELDALFVEGLVGMTALGDDYYEFDAGQLRLVGQRRRRVFQVGDSLQVRVLRVDLEARTIDFTLAEVAEQQPASKRPPAARGARRARQR